MSQKGQIELLILLAVVLLFSVFVSGGLLPNKEASPFQGTVSVNNKCCDSGDGDQCNTISSKNFTWEGERYELIKSDIVFTEGTAHLEPADQNNLQGTTSSNTIDELNNKRLFVNTTQRLTTHPECGTGKDLVWKGHQCQSIENDLIIYVCKTTCIGISVGTGQFDAYMRVSRNEPIPDVIKNCDKSGSPIVANPTAGAVVDQLVCPTGTRDNSMQLGACRLIPRPTGTISWLSPYCKPAIYLYPQEKTDIHVAIAPQGKLTLAIPAYNQDGWQVTAYPSGNITYQGNSYDYLYYEAQIPDLLIEKPKEGFVVSYGELTTLFQDLLPKLGLNDKETSQFSAYWMKALPKSLYYFVGIVNPTNLDTIAPLIINPKPDNTIRVTLYFEALGEKSYANPPVITPVKRNGFTAVEWGGIFKSDLNHPFSCLM